jgi:hypothetical protein
VEHHGGVQIPLRRMLQQCGLKQGHAPADDLPVFVGGGSAF